jgi:hypothetical protein
MILQKAGSHIVTSRELPAQYIFKNELEHENKSQRKEKNTRVHNCTPQRQGLHR